MKRLKREKGEGRQVVVYAPRLEFVSALCMFCTFCRFCRFLQIFAWPPHRPSCTRACISCTRACAHLSRPDRKKNLFTHFCNQPALLSFSYFCRLFNALVKNNNLATPNNVQPLGQNKQHTFLTFNQNMEGKGSFCFLFAVCPFLGLFPFWASLRSEKGEAFDELVGQRHRRECHPHLIDT